MLYHFATGLNVHDDRWNSIAQKVEGRDKTTLNLNQQLDNIKQKLNEAYAHLAITEDIVDAADVKRIYFGDDNRNLKLLEAYKIHNDKLEVTLNNKSKSENTSICWLLLNYKIHDTNKSR
ncbi:MAG: hypothetical protein ACKOXB_03400 [Flavobacteriales bacterium]